MGVLNTEPNLLDMLNKLDDRLRAVEQRRFQVPPIVGTPSVPANSEMFYDYSSATLGLYDASIATPAFRQVTLGSWIPFTPTWTISGYGNVSLALASTARYQLIGKTCVATYYLYSLSTLSSGAWSVTTPPVNTQVGAAFGVGYYFDGSGNATPLMAEMTAGVPNAGKITFRETTTGLSLSRGVTTSAYIGFSIVYDTV